MMWLTPSLTLPLSGGGESRRRLARKPSRPHSYPGFVPKRDRTLTFSATIRRDVNQMVTITVITILVLPAIFRSGVSDQILTGQQQVVASRF